MKRVFIIIFLIICLTLPADALFYPGAKGENIRHLQIALYRKGYYNGVWDGVYSEQVVAAVREYQRQNEAYPDGICTYADAVMLGADIEYNELDEKAIILARFAANVCKKSDYITKLAVCSVIVNRVSSPLFPDSIVEVINAAGGAPPCEIPPDCMRAAYEALLGAMPYGDILYFSNDENKTYNNAVKHGGFSFYR